MTKEQKDGEPQLGLWPYPPVGMIAVMTTGRRILVWAPEADDADCFTGIALDCGDASTFWDRASVAKVEPPQPNESW